MRNDVPRTGRKREKMGGGDGVTGNGAPFPAAHLFPSPHPAMHVIPPPTIGGGGIPTDDQCVMHDGVTAGSFCTSPMSEASPARGQSPVGNVGGAGSREPLQGRRDVSPRITRVCTYEICGNLRGVRAIWLMVVHWY